MLLFQPQCFYRCIKWIARWILKGLSKRARCQVAKEALPLAKEFAAKQGKGIGICFCAYTPLIIIRSRVVVPNSSIVYYSVRILKGMFGTKTKICVLGVLEILE